MIAIARDIRRIVVYKKFTLKHELYLEIPICILGSIWAYYFILLVLADFEMPLNSYDSFKEIARQKVYTSWALSYAAFLLIALSFKILTILSYYTPKLAVLMDALLMA